MDDRATLEDKGTPFEVRDVVVMESARGEIIEEGELAKETTGLIEQLRDEGRGEVASKTEDEKSTEKMAQYMEAPVEAKEYAERKGKKKGKKKGKVEDKKAEELPKQAGDTAEARKPMEGERSQAERLREDKGTVKGAATSASTTSEGNQAYNRP